MGYGAEGVGEEEEEAWGGEEEDEWGGEEDWEEGEEDAGEEAWEEGEEDAGEDAWGAGHWQRTGRDAWAWVVDFPPAPPEEAPAPAAAPPGADVATVVQATLSALQASGSLPAPPAS